MMTFLVMKQVMTEPVVQRISAPGPARCLKSFLRLYPESAPAMVLQFLQALLPEADPADCRVPVRCAADQRSAET